MTEVLEAPESTLPAGHLKAVRRAIRALDNYRSAVTVLETYEDEFRQFRSLQSANRMTTAEAQCRRRWDEVEAAIDALRAA